MKKDLKEFLKTLKVQGQINNVPNITETNAKFIHFLLRSKKAKTVLEIGTAHGYSTLWLADAVSPFAGTVTTIEISNPSYCQSIANFEEAGYVDNIYSFYGDAQKVLQHWKQGVQIIEDTKEVPKGVQYLEKNSLLYKKSIQEIPDTYDVIFLDAQKSLYHEFWSHLSPFMHPDTLIIVDDIGKFSEKTQPFVDLIEKDPNFESVILPIDEDDGVMLIQKNIYKDK